MPSPQSLSSRVFAYLVTIVCEKWRLALAEIGDLKFQAGLYGGIPVNLFESSRSDDYIVGSYIKLKPWKGGKFRIDHTWLEEDVTVSSNDEDHLWGARFTQQLGYLRFHSAYSRLDDRDRDMEGRLTFAHPELDLQVQASYYQQMRTIRDLVTQIDPFVAALIAYEPFHQIRLHANKGIGETVALQACYDVRWLKNDRDQAVLNREWLHGRR